jgi:hypothetical protein
MVRSSSISFENKSLFGTGFSRLKSDECRIFSKVLEYIDPSSGKPYPTINNIGLNFLWAYIYYLVKHNPTHPILRQMVREEEAVADAKLFLSVVGKGEGGKELTPQDLADFLMKLWEERAPEVPYLNRIYAFVIERLKASETQTAKTFSDLEERVSHVRELVDKMKDVKPPADIGFVPQLVVTPRGDPYEVQGSVNLAIRAPPKPT